MEVHHVLGHGFLEAVYQQALARELTLRGIPFSKEQSIPVSYKGAELDVTYRADFVCYGSVIVELKSIKALTATEESQVINYLKATGFKKALLFNFGTIQLEYRRLVLEKYK
jgi:GxxExxY protein